MANIKIKVLTPEEKAQREEFMFAHHVKHTTKKGDWHFTQAENISGDGDYIRGKDDDAFSDRRYD